jgi:hypothetical protein
MYTDLDKAAKGGFIIEDALVLNEVFDTALNVRRGQIFYCRGLGQDFEYYLLRLNEPSTLLGIQDELFRLRDIDGRLLVDPSQTQVYTSDNDAQAVIIQTALDIQGLPEVSVTGMLEESTNTSVAVATASQTQSSAMTSYYSNQEESGDYTLTLNDGRKLEFKDSKLTRIIEA